MSKSFRKDLTGQRFGRLTVIEFVSTEDKYSHWKCECDCGNNSVVRIGDLTAGHIQSCGCWQKEMLAQRKTTHHMTNTRLYHIWVSMKQRCYNPKHISYKNYGGSGIKVCAEWKNDFQKFYDWAMLNGYSDDLTIDRIDTKGNYKPTNCQWADAKSQACNRRNNIVVKFQDRQLTLSEVSEITGINYWALKNRYHRGDRGEKLLRPTTK